MKYSFKLLLQILCFSSIVISCIPKKEIANNPKQKSVTKVKNIILLIGDGMGLSQVSASQYYHKNKSNFDCIFIDGLHEYKQVKKDILNSLDSLNENGIILLHDCLPKSMSQQAVPRFQWIWNGDVWKSIVKFRCRNDLDIVTCKIDHGISIIRKINNKDPLLLDIKNFKELKFKDFNKDQLLNVSKLGKFSPHDAGILLNTNKLNIENDTLIKGAIYFGLKPGCEKCIKNDTNYKSLSNLICFQYMCKR